ncbi:hypothetical protein LOAG_15845 [Loa loa]|uniref:Uncharacterized protein n=1 Tax=Loa loa TaxID=7209 RepID=A0A1S0TET2_LOALO|nr:hypothetical protein LOAG_15845 [Loa loa]EFO12688.1 hypothetical protein LOAG_15845 [Loa loa]
MIGLVADVIPTANNTTSRNYKFLAEKICAIHTSLTYDKTSFIDPYFPLMPQTRVTNDL